MEQDVAIEKIIEHLSRIQSTPKLFLGNNNANPEVALAHLFGIRDATLILLNFQGFQTEIQDEAARRRGWWYQADGFIPALKRRGLNDAEIVAELIGWEIEFWKIYGERLTS